MGVKKKKDHAKCNVKKRHGIPKKQSKTAEIRQKTTWDTPKTTCLQRGLWRGSKRVTESTKMTATTVIVQVGVSKWVILVTLWKSGWVKVVEAICKVGVLKWC